MEDPPGLLGVSHVQEEGAEPSEVAIDRFIGNRVCGLNRAFSTLDELDFSWALRCR
ncbi:hypothetical protein MICRO8M_100387 [Microbacterium sp. 8M]|nr:hypothetical protein MICRO8M_100387 [Microbacterium sp. 8M]